MAESQGTIRDLQVARLWLAGRKADYQRTPNPTNLRRLEVAQRRVDTAYRSMIAEHPEKERGRGRRPA